MAKSLLESEAKQLRRKGMSIKNIASKLHVSKNSVSFWLKDIILTVEQLKKIKQSQVKGSEIGRIKSILIHKEKRRALMEKYRIEGASEISSLNKRELFLVGLALYWAEGTKSFRDRRAEFCNSDPRMIKLLILWFKKCLDVKSEDLKCVVGINQIHQSREKTVTEYWSKLTGIPLDQFRKTSFKKVSNKKIYDNFDNHYGTLSVLVAKSTHIYYKIMALIEGLGSVDYKAA